MWIKYASELTDDSGVGKKVLTWGVQENMYEDTLEGGNIHFGGILNLPEEYPFLNVFLTGL